MKFIVFSNWTDKEYRYHDDVDEFDNMCQAVECFNQYCSRSMYNGVILFDAENDAIVRQYICHNEHILIK